MADGVRDMSLNPRKQVGVILLVIVQITLQVRDYHVAWRAGSGTRVRSRGVLEVQQDPKLEAWVRDSAMELRPLQFRTTELVDRLGKVRVTVAVENAIDVVPAALALRLFDRVLHYAHGIGAAPDYRDIG